MRHNLCYGVPLILLISLIVISHTSASFVHTKPGEKIVELDDESINTSDEGSIVDLDTIYSFNEMMGLENCGSGDEKCLKRRVLAEAHLDYIYTQHHKP